MTNFPDVVYYLWQPVAKYDVGYSCPGVLGSIVPKCEVNETTHEVESVWNAGERPKYMCVRSMSECTFVIMKHEYGA